MSRTKNFIYLDYAATTPVDKEVLKEMLPYFSYKFGNASSVHSFGQEAIAAIDQSREKIAKFFNCDFSEIILYKSELTGPHSVTHTPLQSWALESV